MYTPRSFAESDLPTLFDFLNAHPLGILVSETPEHLAATHLPLILDRSAGPFGTLFGHLARANPLMWHGEPRENWSTSTWRRAWAI